MQARKISAVGVLLIGVVAVIGLAYGSGVAAQEDVGRSSVLSPSTEVGGIINTSTTWTQANSPYVLTNHIQIAPEVTLTIESGVVVSATDRAGALEVFGTLLVAGTANQNVVLKGIEVYNGSVTFMEPYLIDIKHTQFNAGGFVLTGRGSLSLRDSFLQNLVNFSPGNSQADTYIHIESNIIQRSASLQIGGYSNSHAYIRNNVFADTTTFLWASIAVNSGTITVEHNTFVDTNRLAISLASGLPFATEVDARNNYWSTNDPDIIAGMIYDRNDDLNVAHFVQFEPFLTGPHPDTPTYGPTVIYLPSITSANDKK